MNYSVKTDREVKELARDWMEGRIYTSDDLRRDRPNASAMELGMTFMPIALAKQTQLDEMRAADITLLYEYMTKAEPRSINGRPIFFSVRYLNRTDHQRLYEAAKQYQTMREQFLVPDDVKPSEAVADDVNEDASPSPQSPASPEVSS